MYTHMASRVWVDGKLDLSSQAKRHREVSRHQRISNSSRELALHHRDVRDLLYGSSKHLLTLHHFPVYFASEAECKFC